MSTVRKAIAAALTSLVANATAVTVSPSEQITSGEWVTIAGGLVAAFLVWLIPNSAAPAFRIQLRRRGDQ